MSEPEKSVSVRPIAELAALYGVSERTVGRWKRDGVDVNDPQAVEAYKATLQDHKTPGGSDAKALKEEKLRADTREKIAKAEMAELSLAKLKGELLSVSDLQETMVFIASRVKAHVTKLEKDLPPRLEGKRAVEMVPLVREAAESILLSLSNDLASFDAPTGGDVREETD